MITVTPTIETERLVLRGWRNSDLAPLADFYANDAEAVFVGGPRQGSDVGIWFMSRIGQWAMRGYGAFAIEEKATGDWVGWCGANHYPGISEPSVQYALGSVHRGKGFMTEAGRPALDFVFKATSRDVLATTIHPANAASQNAARRLGASPDGTQVLDDGHMVDVWRFARRGGAL